MSPYNVIFGLLDSRPPVGNYGRTRDWSVYLDSSTLALSNSSVPDRTRIILRGTYNKYYDSGLAVVINGLIDTQTGNVKLAEKYMVVGGQSAWGEQMSRTNYRERDVGFGIVDVSDKSNIFTGMKRPGLQPVSLMDAGPEEYTIGTPIIFEVDGFGDGNVIALAEDYEKLETDYSHFFDQNHGSSVRMVVGDNEGNILIIKRSGGFLDTKKIRSFVQGQIRLNGLNYTTYFTDDQKLGMDTIAELRVPQIIAAGGNLKEKIEGGLEAILDESMKPNMAKLILREAHKRFIVL